MLKILKLVFWPIYRMGLRDAAQVAQDYAYDIIGKPDDSGPLRASAYSHTAQSVAASNIAASLRKMASAAILLFALAFTASAQITSEPTVPPIAQAPVVVKYEKNAGDTVRAAVAYLDSRVPLTEREYDEVVNGFAAEADLRLFKLGKFRGSAAYIFQQRNNEEVYPLYFDGMRIVSLYRNVRTHYVGFQLGYTLGYAVEPFVGYYIGTNKVHEDANRQITSKVRAGVNIVPFGKESPFFIKAAIDLNRSYGSPNKMQPLPVILPATIGGFVNPENRQVVIGAGFRFGR